MIELRMTQLHCCSQNTRAIAGSVGDGSDLVSVTARSWITSPLCVVPTTHLTNVRNAACNRRNNRNTVASADFEVANVFVVHVDVHKRPQSAIVSVGGACESLDVGSPSSIEASLLDAHTAAAASAYRASYVLLSPGSRPVMPPNVFSRLAG